MAMSADEINASLARAFSAYATKQRRAGLVLGNTLTILRREAELARLDPQDFDRMARRQMAVADARMRSDVATLHPVAVVATEAS